MEFKFFNLFVGDFFFWIIDLFLVIAISFFLITVLILELYVKSSFFSKLVTDLVFPILFVIVFLLNLQKELFFFFYGNVFFINGSIIYLVYVLLFLLFFIFFLSRYYFIVERFVMFEYIIFLLFVFQAAIMLLKLNNLFVLYAVIEMQNFCFYILATMKRYSNYSIESGLKYFLLGSFSSGLLLFGISMMYTVTGNLVISELLYFSNENYIFILSIFFIFAGLFFKLGLAPFHWWVPEVYFGAPTNITLLFSTFPKIILLFIVIKILYFLSFEFFIFFLSFSISSLFFGGINALYEGGLKRFLAFSSIFNIGFIFSAFSLDTIEMVVSIIFYLVSYLLIVCLIFAFLIEVRIGRENKEFSTILDLGILLRSNLWLSFIMSFIVFSFVGLPPLFMFFGKFFLIINLVNNFEYLFGFILLCFSVFSGFYYVRLMRFVFFSYDTEIFFLTINNDIKIFIFIFFLSIFGFFFLDLFLLNITNIILNFYG